MNSTERRLFNRYIDLAITCFVIAFFLALPTPAAKGAALILDLIFATDSISMVQG